MNRAAPSRLPIGCSAADIDRGPAAATRKRVGVVCAVRAMCAASLLAVGSVDAATPSASGVPAARPSVSASSSQEGPVWSELKPAQQAALAPLLAEWPSLDVRNKRKWLELADRFPRLTPAEQARVQARMGEWVRMTPSQRGEARFNFQQAKQLPPTERQARWNAYQALPPDEKSKLAARSAAQASAPADPLHRSGLRPARETVVGGSGLAPVAAPRTVGPTLVQSTPGATTTLIDRRPTPPEHQRPGRSRLGAGSAAALRSAGTPARGASDAGLGGAPAAGVGAPVPAPVATTPNTPPVPLLPPAAPATPGGTTPVGPRSDTEPGAPGR